MEENPDVRLEDKWKLVSDVNQALPKLDIGIEDVWVSESNEQMESFREKKSAKGIEKLWSYQNKSSSTPENDTLRVNRRIMDPSQ